MGAFSANEIRAVGGEQRPAIYPGRGGFQPNWGKLCPVLRPEGKKPLFAVPILQVPGDMFSHS